MINNQNWESFVRDILESHYDPTYHKSMQHNFGQIEQVVSLNDLSDSCIENCVDSLVPSFVGIR